MENIETVQQTSGSKKKASAPKRSMMLKKIDLETAKQLQQFKDRVNKKAFGRKIRDAELLALAVSLLSDDHIQALQETTYSEKDRLNLVHSEFQKSHGKISMDHFIGKLLRGEIQNKN